MASFAVEKETGSWGSFNVPAPDNAVGRVTSADSYILGGWLQLSKTDNFAVTPVFGKSEASGTSFVDASYYITITDATKKLKFNARINGSTIGSVESSIVLSFGVKYFVLCWVNVGAGTLNIKIDNNATDSQSVTITSFSDPGGDFFIGKPTGGSDEFAIHGLWDEWFFCKNPPSISAAITAINQMIYNGGFGTQFDSLSASFKTKIGLVAWWGFDEPQTAPPLDLFDKFGNITFTDSQGELNLDRGPLVTGNARFSDLVESIATADTRKSDVEIIKTEALTLADAITRQFQRTLSEDIFLSDVIHTSPLLRPLNETIRLSAWLSLKLNPPVEKWFD